MFSICWNYDWQNHIAKFSKMACWNQITHKKKWQLDHLLRTPKKFHSWHCILSDLKVLKILFWGLHCKQWPFTIFGRLIVNASFSFPCIAPIIIAHLFTQVLFVKVYVIKVTFVIYRKDSSSHRKCSIKRCSLKFN